MPKSKLIVNLDNIKTQTTSHSIGEKCVFFSNDDLQSSITQVAIGSLKPGENIPPHLHKTMEEVFYIMSGDGTFYIEDEKIYVEENSCIRIPIGSLHSIKANTPMQFFYFGVATN